MTKNQKTRIIRISLLIGTIASLFLTFSCVKKQNSLEKIFSASELSEIDRIIDFYDQHVLAKTDKNLSIEEAYRLFIENNRPDAEYKGDEDAFFIDSKARNKFLKSVDMDLLLEIYEKHDSAIIVNPKSKEQIVIYPPFHLSVCLDGKFFDFVTDLSSRKTYYKEYVEDITSMIDISPGIIARLLYEENLIDFSSREERFVFIVSFLRYEKDLYDYYVYRKGEG